MNGYLRFRDRFAEAIDPRLFNIDHLDAIMLSGRGKCLVTDNAAIVAEIRNFPSGARAVCGVVAATREDNAGHLPDITGLLIPAAEDWGRDYQCRFGMIDSTAAWAREMKQHGYETHQVSLIKEL